MFYKCPYCEELFIIKEQGDRHVAVHNKNLKKEWQRRSKEIKEMQKKEAKEKLRLKKEKEGFKKHKLKHKKYSDNCKTCLKYSFYYLGNRMYIGGSINDGVGGNGGGGGQPAAYFIGSYYFTRSVNTMSTFSSYE